MDDESRRLASYQKNLFQVFKLSESAAGFQAKPNALGVFESKAAKSGKLRVSLAQLPDSPARLNVGSYTISLDVLLEYVETRECIAGGCVGKTQNMVRSCRKRCRSRYRRKAVLPARASCRSSMRSMPSRMRRITASVIRIW